MTGAIVNPRAGGGSARRRWPRVALRLGPIETRFTEGPGHGAELARELARSGCDLLVVAGGDGALNEVINGVAGCGVRLAVLPFGSGGDFARTLGLRSLDQAVKVLAAGQSRPVDVFRARFRAPGGSPAERLFINAASFGLGAAVARNVKRWSGAIPGRWRYLGAAIPELAAGSGLHVRLSVDGSPPAPLDVTTVALSNGRFQGGGIHIAPEALIDDGLIDITIVRHVSLGEVMTKLPILYSGAIYSHPKVLLWRGSRVRAEADAETAVELDGEVVGSLPLEVSVLAQAVRIMMPSAAAE